jgi:uncharacterized repeat protein (TIGR03843 family)
MSADEAFPDEPPPDDEADVWPTPELIAAAAALDTPAALELLRNGDLDLLGWLPASSNNAMVGTISTRVDGSAGGDAARPGRNADAPAPCVYKPIRGERPLWDFPDGTLAAREVAAFELSEATPWAIAPPTVLREGRFGRGMVQLWLEPDPTVDRVAMVVDGDPRLRAVALFDAVANNADRKIGHLLPQADGHVFGVDHGICFHEEPKLRTVLWRWQGEPIRDDERGVLAALRAALDGRLASRLSELLTRDEVEATRSRLDALLADGCFPRPDPDRPAIPWPPY